MTDDIYKKIRDENEKRYGTDVKIYGPVLLQRLYSDRTHFIYELIQNAEDACERARSKAVEEEFYLVFNLFQDRLDVWHNGIPFDEEDVKGICGIVAGTKNDDHSQIGKFGIGFKSVYAYTKSPEIYSNNLNGESYYFSIKNYVSPYRIKPLKILGGDQTLIRLPFNHLNVGKEEAYKEIYKRLTNLDLRIPLFLKNITEIIWNIGEKRGKNIKHITDICDKYKYIDLYLEDKKKRRKSEKWLVFDKDLIGIYNDIKIEIAFLIETDDKGIQRIVPSHYSKIYTYFTTERETHLKFLIQGPYQTTVARDNILQNEYNNNLIIHTADLFVEILSDIKNMNLLNTSFLNTLPIEFEYYQEEDFVFSHFYSKIKQKLLSEDPILPKYKGGYITSKQALLGRTKEVKDLLSIEQLSMLFDKNRIFWLDEDITIDKTLKLREYLMKELKIPEISVEMFVRNINTKFIEAQTDEWIIKFYTFLTNRNALWRQKRRYNQDEGIIRSKPFIRLENGNHTRPYDKNGNPLAFLPSIKFGTLFPMVKQKIANNPQAKYFLNQLGLKEPGVVSRILMHVIPIYISKNIKVSKEENITHVKWIIDALKSIDSNKIKTSFYNKISEVNFLYASNNKISKYKKPREIYVGKSYTNNDEINLFFEDNNNIWFLDDRYNDHINIQDLKELGCNIDIKVIYKEPEWGGYVDLSDYSYHKRGLNGFYPGCSIEGLEYALKNITHEKAVIIWDILKKYVHSIYGTIEKSSRQDYLFSDSEDTYSRMGVLLSEYKWVPNVTGGYYKPTDTLLSELPPVFNVDSPESKLIAEKLHFKKAVDEKVLEQLPENTRTIYKEIIGLSENELEKTLKFVKLLKESRKTAPEISIMDAQEQFISELDNDDGTSNSISVTLDNLEWTGLSPEEEDTIRQEYGNELPERWETIGFAYHTKLVKESKITDLIDPKEFLHSEYNGHCQICNTRLDIGAGRKPIIWVRRLIENQNKHPFANMEFNVLGLCPNCHTLLKYGSTKLKNIIEVAKKVLRKEIAPEELEERRGDYYIVNVMIAEKEQNIYYSPSHMQKLAAFLTQQVLEPQ